MCSILIYNSISKLTERNAFSKARVKTFLIVGFITLGTGLVKDSFSLFIARELLLYRTNNMFYLVTDGGFFYYMIAAPFLIFVYFIHQGNKLQEEQELIV